jgi:DNA repair exonuclease SbcCD nuclease subunit
VVRFLHTADWQLGMTRHFLGPEAMSRFAQDRIDAIERMAELASDRACAFAVVCGDVFETNQVERKTVQRALEALSKFSMPVYLLPGNHDPLDAASVYRSSVFVEGCPEHVRVLDGREPEAPVEGVEVVGAPWRSKRPLEDLASAAAAACAPDPAITRILVAHGQIDALVPDTPNPALIRKEALERAIDEGRVQFVALGDRHSARQVGESGRIWYAGAPEATAYREDDPGNALVVDCDREHVRVEAVRVGRWQFVEIDEQVDGRADVDALLEALAALDDKPRAVVKLGLRGTLNLRERERLEAALGDLEDRLAALERPARRQALHLRPSDDDLAELPLRGYAAAARDRLVAMTTAGGEDADVAADALGLLVRLAHAKEATR